MDFHQTSELSAQEASRRVLIRVRWNIIRLAHDDLLKARAKRSQCRMSSEMNAREVTVEKKVGQDRGLFKRKDEHSRVLHRVEDR